MFKHEFLVKALTKAEQDYKNAYPGSEVQKYAARRIAKIQQCVMIENEVAAWNQFIG